MFHEKDADGRISRGTRREGRVSWRDASGPRSMRRGRLPSCADVGPTAVPAEGRRDRRRRSQWTSVGQLMRRCRLRHHRRRHGSHHVQELPRRPMQSKSLVPPPHSRPHHSNHIKNSQFDFFKNAWPLNWRWKRFTGLCLCQERSIFLKSPWKRLIILDHQGVYSSINLLWLRWSVTEQMSTYLVINWD